MKRKRSSHVGRGARKKARRDVHAGDQSASATPAATPHPVLQRLYPQVLTLRRYLLSRLPGSSRSRRRKISQLGQPTATQDAIAPQDIDVALGRLLDSTLVGTNLDTTDKSQEYVSTERDQDIETFTQQRAQSTTGATFKPGYLLHSEIVNFVVWCLFKRSTTQKPSHLLCHGFQRSAQAPRQQELATNSNASIPGLLERHPNSYVRSLKGPLWCRLHAVLGQGGDRIVMDLLLDCSIFSPIEGNLENYYQLGGIPISDLKPDQAPGGQATKTGVDVKAGRKQLGPSSDHKTPNSITFVRSRMLYAKAALNAKGGVRFGMRHIHVLNRFPNRDDRMQTIHIMRYIFPRQFHLHNPFTSKVDSRETAMPFKDYTLREKEIHHAMCRELGDAAPDAHKTKKWQSHVPKRLRGATVALVDKLRTLNERCSYMELLRHYCPVEGVPLSPRPEWRKNPLQPRVGVATVVPLQANTVNSTLHPKSRTIEQTCFTDMACPTAHVSAFCRAVISKVIPQSFWGDDSNRSIIMYWVDQFIFLRRFESLTLHQVTQKLQITTLAWLQLPCQDGTASLAKTDFVKRQEIFFELVYWLFDSFLIPLIRSNFHVTESNVHRNRLFYFRHDVWRMLTEPALKTLKLSMFEEMPIERTTKLLSARQLGFSNVRLLPKKLGFRTIMNLKRRQQVVRNGVASLGRSINTVMTPVFNAITYEKSLQPDKFGCSLFSVGDMFSKLTAFKTSLQKQNLSHRSLYFAKVDVQSCFDTIPQARLLSMISSLMSTQAYQTGKHVEISPLGALQRLDGQHVNPMPLKRYVAHSGAAADVISFSQLVQDKLVGSKANTVFVKTDMQRCETKDDLMHLLREHVERNLVKIGKRYYRQKTGIPQGSILSSIMCNFFYAELERDVLGFALGGDCLLLRLLDDFLLITVNPDIAQRFVRVMHRGHADYGVVVKTAKSLTNFDTMTNDGTRVPKSAIDSRFPYCGVWIDTATLEVSRNIERHAATDTEDSLTVDLSKMPGQTFHRKALNAFKIQLKAMFIDTWLNSVATVMGNFYRSFHDAAVRCLEYARVLSKVRTTCTSLLIKTVDSMIALAYVMLQRRSRSRSNTGAKVVQGVISRRQLQWLACKAFQTVFRRRQTQHRTLLVWLDAALAAGRISNTLERDMLEQARTWH